MKYTNTRTFKLRFGTTIPTQKNGTIAFGGVGASRSFEIAKSLNYYGAK